MNDFEYKKKKDEPKDPKTEKNYLMFKTFCECDDVFSMSDLEKLIRSLMSKGLEQYDMFGSTRKNYLLLFRIRLGKWINNMAPMFWWICENKIKDEIYFYGIDSGEIDEYKQICEKNGMGFWNRVFIDLYLKGIRTFDAEEKREMFKNSKDRYAKIHEQKYSNILGGESYTPNYKDEKVRKGIELANVDNRVNVFVDSFKNKYPDIK